MADENNYSAPSPSSNVHGRVFEVIKASRKDFDGIEGQGKKRLFGKSGGFVVKDAKEAKEISDRYGYAPGGSRDVIVVARDDYGALGKRNLHSVPALPWKEEE